MLVVVVVAIVVAVILIVAVSDWWERHPEQRSRLWRRVRPPRTDSGSTDQPNSFPSA